MEIVLFNPQIPQNTGNIGRLCVNTNTKLHLVKPIGFSLEEKYVKRSGLDYWQHLNLTVHESWEDFTKIADTESMFFFSTKTDHNFWECSYKSKDTTKPAYLIFGSETSGLTPQMYNDYKERLYTIPMFGQHCRSYNLSNSVAIVLFEGLRRYIH
ncbi:MAG: tRNA (cytidine(34)-2'-O)-methyltransferase [bacterium]|nr:tRNA (cytidine(34)-2'-O)-methyltransferase [bacterium]